MKASRRHRWHLSQLVHRGCHDQFVGLALFDVISKKTANRARLSEAMWSRKLAILRDVNEIIPAKDPKQC